VTAVGILLAQCATGVDCDLPRTLPWYFGFAIAAAWFATVVGAVLLIRRRLITRRARRSEVRRDPVESRKSGDVELW
jgi:nitrate reductase gamma subunit